jgi:hypothetical protein
MGKAYGFGMYGMWGPLTDPGEAGFSARVRDECGVDMGDSPYRDYQAGTIAAIIDHLPEDATVLVWGTSLGANNCTVVGSYTKRTIHGMWGFQASLFGAKVPITPNVKFAHLIYSTNPVNFGLGAYVWIKASGNETTNYYKEDRPLPHPGDYDIASQNMFIAEIKRVIAAP